MNSLSWFLYLADAVSSLGRMFSFLGVIALIFGMLATIAWMVARGGLNAAKDRGAEKSALEWGEWVAVWNVGRRFLSIGFVLLVVSALLPSKNTFYAIAASQVGEQIVKSEQVQGVADDATKALRQWIRRQIEPEKKEGK